MQYPESQDVIGKLEAKKHLKGIKWEICESIPHKSDLKVPKISEFEEIIPKNQKSEEKFTTRAWCKRVSQTEEGQSNFDQIETIEKYKKSESSDLKDESNITLSGRPKIVPYVTYRHKVCQSLVLNVHPTTLEPLSRPSSKICQYSKSDELLAISNSLRNLIQVGIFIKAEEAIETIFPSEENEFYTKGPAEQLLSDANSSISIQQIKLDLPKSNRYTWFSKKA